MTTSRLALCTAALATFAACGDDQPPGPDPRFAALATAVQADLDRNPATAASVAVWLDGQIVWVGGFGHRDPDGGAAPGVATQFMIGSDTKKLTAITTLQAVAAGTTTLDATVGAVLSDLHLVHDPDFARATVRDLLSHRGGVADGVEATTAATDAGLAAYAYGAFAQTYPALAPPGTFWNYSNPNFSIAGLIDQQLDGRPWADLVEQDVFEPLGMTRTVARKAEVDAVDYALGFGPTVGADDPPHRVALAELWESAFVRPAGLVWSTPSDQMRLAAFLVDGDPAVLAPELRRELTTGQTPMYPDLPGAYGLGLMIGRGVQLGDQWYDVPVWLHGGDTLTHTSTFYVLPDQRFAISILSNGGGDDFSASVAMAIATLVDLPPAAVAPRPPFEPAQLDGLTGTYVDPNGLDDIVVTRVGDVLQLSVPVLDQAGVAYDHAMTAVSTRVWLAQIDGTTVDLAFIDGAHGETYLRNRDVVAVRPAAGAVAPPRAPDRRAVAPAAVRVRALHHPAWVPLLGATALGLGA